MNIFHKDESAMCIPSATPMCYNGLGYGESTNSVFPESTPTCCHHARRRQSDHLPSDQIHSVQQESFDHFSMDLELLPLQKAGKESRAADGRLGNSESVESFATFAKFGNEN